MTSHSFKRWTSLLVLSVLLILVLFSLTSVTYYPILDSSGEENQVIHFFEGFEKNVVPEILLEDFDIDVTGEVPYGITSDSVHGDNASFFVGPSTCNSFCFDDFSVELTIPSINLTSGEYNVLYWRRESYDFGGSNTIFINGLEVYNEDADDGVFNTLEDTGWYQRNITYTGSIDSITFKETDLTASNTIYLDDITIQDTSNIEPSNIETSTIETSGIETSTITTTELDHSSEQTNEQTTKQPTSTTADNSQPTVKLLDPTIPQSGLAFGLMISLLIVIAVISKKTRNSKSNY